MHILHTHSHEGFFALIATLAHAIWRAIVLIIVGIYRYRTGTVPVPCQLPYRYCPNTYNRAFPYHTLQYGQYV